MALQGNGTAEFPYLVSTKEELIPLLTTKDAHIRLLNDITTPDMVSDQFATILNFAVLDLNGFTFEYKSLTSKYFIHKTLGIIKNGSLSSVGFGGENGLVFVYGNELLNVENVRIILYKDVSDLHHNQPVFSGSVFLDLKRSWGVPEGHLAFKGVPLVMNHWHGFDASGFYTYDELFTHHTVPFWIEQTFKLENGKLVGRTDNVSFISGSVNYQNQPLRNFRVSAIGFNDELLLESMTDAEGKFRLNVKSERPLFVKAAQKVDLKLLPGAVHVGLGYLPEVQNGYLYTCTQSGTIVNYPNPLPTTPGEIAIDDAKFKVEPVIPPQIYGPLYAAKAEVPNG